MVKIICVLKKGGWCDYEDVLNLKEQLRINVKSPYEFVCYSDDETVATVKLEHNYNGWWSKVEIFKETDSPCIFLDLDTAIFCDLQKLIDYISKDERRFLMLKPFYTERNRRQRGRNHQYASGVMAWNGDFKYILDGFSDRLKRAFLGDQEYIQGKLIDRGEDIGYVNKCIDHIKSYRWHCRKSIPKNLDVCCFHGNPRPKKVGMPFWGYHKNNYSGDNQQDV